MEFNKILVSFRSYLNSPEVKNISDPKIYKGMLKIENDALSDSSVKTSSASVLHGFYSVSPANIKLFYTTNVNKFNTGLKRLYDDSWSDSAKKFDVYRKFLIFLSYIKLVKFYNMVVGTDSSITIELIGISKNVFSRVEIVHKILNMNTSDIKAKSPDKSVILYLEMGLRRIITMEVGSDDWDK